MNKGLSHEKQVLNVGLGYALTREEVSTYSCKYSELESQAAVDNRYCRILILRQNLLITACV
jgi:hypothetical protein